ncbi:flavin-containing monooxygenase [Microlunatus ginsengisoli]|uniref:NAD(P)/FAD-dependent oxidoreductase n=1 Tax=Microlunatus ginsengisoli TaxID=363863 RepID=A0ABP7AKH5_9ACTN
MPTTHLPTVVIGGGQSGLAMGYHLRRTAEPFVILDAEERTGDTWRRRWDSLRLFSLPRYASLPGLPITTPSYPTKDQVADYLERYAEHFQLPIRRNTRVRRLSRDADRFVIETPRETFTADRVVVATGSLVRSERPAFSRLLDPEIAQLDASGYRSPAGLEGEVLVVGAGTAGSDVAIDVARAGLPTVLAGPHPGQLPLALDSLLVRAVMPLVMFGFLHVLTLGNPAGRHLHRRLLRRGTPLIRYRRRDLVAAGVRRTGLITDVVDGLPRAEDGTVFRPRTVIWCTGFRPEHSWIDLPIFDPYGQVQQVRGITAVPGLYFLGLSFQYSVSSAALHGLDRDARHLLRDIRRERSGRTVGLGPARSPARTRPDQLRKGEQLRKVDQLRKAAGRASAP